MLARYSLKSHSVNELYSLLISLNCAWNYKGIYIPAIRSCRNSYSGDSVLVLVQTRQLDISNFIDMTNITWAIIKVINMKSCVLFKITQ